VHVSLFNPAYGCHIPMNVILLELRKSK